MQILSNNTIMLKSFFTYSVAVAIVLIAFFSATTAEAGTTYVLDLTGNGCGGQCAQLQEYLNSLNTGNSNSNNNSTSTNGTSTSTSTTTSTTSTSTSGTYNPGYTYTPAPNLQYNYSPSTLSYYKNSQTGAGTGTAPGAVSAVGKYPAYTYFRNPADSYYGSQTQNPYPPQQYVYYGSAGAMTPSQVAARGPSYAPSYPNTAYGNQYSSYNPYGYGQYNPYAQMPYGSSPYGTMPASNTGFTMTSR